MDWDVAFPVLCVFIGAPSVVFTFVYMVKRGRNDLEALRIKKDMLELEVERERLRVAALAEENRKYDRLIEGSGDPGAGRPGGGSPSTLSR